MKVAQSPKIVVAPFIVIKEATLWEVKIWLEPKLKSKSCQTTIRKWHSTSREVEEAEQKVLTVAYYQNTHSAQENSIKSNQAANSKANYCHLTLNIMKYYSNKDQAKPKTQ